MGSVVDTLRSKDWITDCSDTIPNMETAFDVQDSAVAAIAPDRGGFAGYKIAFNSPALLEKMAIPHPGMGRIFSNQVQENGARLDVPDYRHFMIEPEIAAVLGADLTPDTTYSADQAENAVERYYPAFELLDRRNVEGMMHVPTIIAHNVFNAGVVLGGPGLRPDEFDYRSVETVCTDNEELVVQGVGIAPQNPAEALAFLANHFTGRGQVMPKGSIILLGAHCPLYKVNAGRKMRLSLGALGTASFET